MPNHVTNKLTISGREEDVKEFHNRITREDQEPDNSGLIRSFLPFPEELKGEYIRTATGEIFARAFSPDGYTWCIDNWGTKWADYDLDVLSDPWGFPGDPTWAASYQYTTAWSPAHPAIITISTMQPDILFSVAWEEEGNQSAGCLVCKNGKYSIENAGYDDRPKWPVGDETDDTIQDYYEAWESMMDNLETAAWRSFMELGVE